MVATAHEVGLPVAAHCHGIGGIAEAVRAGVDTLEHCTFFTSDGRSEPDEALLGEIAARGVVISATLGRDPAIPPPPLVAANQPRISNGKGISEGEVAGTIEIWAFIAFGIGS